LPLLSAKELCKFLEKEDFLLIRQKGSHMFCRHPDGRTTLVPFHTGKDISRGLLRVILEEINMPREDFFNKFK